MLSKGLIVIGALALAATTAVAAPDVTYSKDKVRVSVPESAADYTAPPAPPKGLTTVFNNIGTKYPDGLYFCCDGLTVSGPDTELGQEVWPAIAFTPKSNLTVSEVEAAVGYDGGTNDFVITIADDSAGLPNNFLASTHVSNLSAFGDCCGLAVAKFKGVKLKGGQQYWVVINTDDQDTDASGAWSFNSTEMKNSVRFAENYGKGWQLINAAAKPAPSFAVFGK